MNCGSFTNILACSNSTCKTTTLYNVVTQSQSGGICPTGSLILMDPAEYVLLQTDQKVTVSPAVATQADYTALATIFGVVLAAAAVIWGTKQVLNLLLSRPES